MQHYSIGAVSKLTDIPAHTLRKWESRHGIARPLRSPTGRRVYTDQHVATLKLIKQLVGTGHALAHLAVLDEAQLHALADQHAEPARPTVTAVTLVGPTISRLLPNHRVVTERFDGSFQQWMQGEPRGYEEHPLVVETETIPAETLALLTDLCTQVERLVVVYTFAPSRALRQLRDAGASVIRGPLTDDGLTLLLAPVSAPQGVSIAQQRFSTRELSRIVALNPALQCECPNHIAKLLLDITSFEKYSLECTVSEPQDQALHNQLAEISAQARVLFEDALIAVANADGIELNANA